MLLMLSLKLTPLLGDGNLPITQLDSTFTAKFKTNPVYRGRKRNTSDPALAYLINVV